MYRCAMFGIFLALTAVSVPPQGWATDPSEGLDLAEQWCSSCHAIAAGRASDKQAPSFESIVNERGRSDEWIATWLSTPHEAMPDLALSREDIAALVAYLASLRQSE